MINKIIGNNISIHRKNKNLSMNDFKIITNIGANHLSRIENGLMLPSLDILYKICAGLGITIGEVLPSQEQIDKLYKISNVDLKEFKKNQKIQALKEKLLKLEQL